MRSNIASRGRAKLARPSLLLLATLVMFLGLVPVARATLSPPILTETNPASPGASLTPRIKGRLDEVETKVIHFGSGFLGVGGPIARGLEPNNIVRIYTVPNCTGPVEGEGTASKLESEGIQVTVSTETTTTFYADQSDGEGGTSECSPGGLAYRQVASPPQAPTLDSVSPPSPANDNFPRLLGSADPEATVSIYPSSNCTGAPLASATGSVLATPGIQVGVPDNSETTFSAKAMLAGFSSGCSAGSVVYQEVTPPPSTPPTGGGSPGGGGTTVPTGPTPSPGPPPPAPRLRTVPGGTANDNTPTVTGSAPGASSVKLFSGPDCGGAAVAKLPAAQFAGSGVEVQVPDNVTVAFSALSISGAGQSACSAPVLYVEDSTAPHTRITMGPGAKTAKRKAVFRFTDTTGAAPGTTFLCKVDKAKWKRCSSPLRLPHLNPRRYLLQVKAVDPAGNAEVKPAKRSFKVIRHP